MKILITGITGFIGSTLATKLISQGHTVFGLIHRTVNSPTDYTPILVDELAQSGVQFDALINLAGENIAAKPWTEKRKQALYDSRISLTNKLLADLQHAPNTVISMSAVGFYGSHPSKIFSETSIPVAGYTHDLCHAWEQSALKFVNKGARTCVLRLGVVLGDGGALKKMRPAYQFGLGGPIGNGHQGFPWIHIQDVIRLIEFCLFKDTISGTFNAVAPDQITQKTLATSYAKQLRRPILMRTPAFVFRWIFGEMAELLTQGQFVDSSLIQKQGFKFSYPSIAMALAEIEPQ